MRQPASANYSLLDRLLHKIAFSGIEIQKSLSDIEDRIHGRRLAAIAIERPVFITALPRAGTTLLLDLVARLPGFATHTYRYMPFVLCPILWDSISQGFRRKGEARERAHGDGMLVSYDSPEAFEEVVWKSFWPEKYGVGHIELWSDAERNREFEEFFIGHLRKVIALGGKPADRRTRYVSKNNANIARIPLLNAMFPDAVFLVPFRDPMSQVGSLLRQHRRFTGIHADDAFARRYMESIGHHEFGLGLRPIGFPPNPEHVGETDPMATEFWLSYWVSAYRYLSNVNAAGLRFVDFDRLCSNPRAGLEAVCREVGGTRGNDRLSVEASQLHSATRYDEIHQSADPQFVAAAKEIHSDLAARAINRDAEDG